jgi:ubiquinone/menaquinone biosynthesis C-methylase UbiE
MSVETIVQERYAEGAQARQEALCCPVDYDKSLLEMLPREIIEKDYGCGDPSRYVRAGDVVLDLGSGGGKICYMAAQLVGEQGRVIGIDMTDDMLAMAKKYQQEMAQKLGGDRVEFRKAYIQDLALGLDALEQYLAQHPVKTVADWQFLQAWKEHQRQQSPLVADASVSLVISNCVLNLVDKKDRQQMIAEIFRVLQPGGRVAIADIIADEAIPLHLQDDPTLWSGCISGAFLEQEFMQAFLDAGFVAVAYDKWDEQPWQQIEGIEFRSATLTAVKPSSDHLYDGGDAVIYKGPYQSVHDDLGNYYPRGQRIAVSKRTFELLRQGPYAGDFVCISPVSPLNKGCFKLPAGSQRSVQESKGGQHSGGANSACC